MLKNRLYSIAAALLFIPFFSVGNANTGLLPSANDLRVQIRAIFPDQTKILSSQSIALDDRYPNKPVSDIMADNILLTLSYMNGDNHPGGRVDWDKVSKVQKVQFTLKKGEVFAFHEDILTEYNGRVVKTTNSTFSASQGFKSTGYLYGDGVCHLASLMYWSAKEAGLKVNAPTNHDFRAIPGISRENGVSIYYIDGGNWRSTKQNLYIENTLDKDITIELVVDGTKLYSRVIQS